jgi:hypothetical protein
MPRGALVKFLRTGADSGVGLAGMRERIREQMGPLDIKSDETGTLVEVVLPISVPANLREDSPAAFSSSGFTSVCALDAREGTTAVSPKSLQPFGQGAQLCGVHPIFMGDQVVRRGKVQRKTEPIYPLEYFASPQSRQRRTRTSICHALRLLSRSLARSIDLAPGKFVRRS